MDDDRGLACPCGGAYGGVEAEEARYRIVRCVLCGLLATLPRTVFSETDYGQDYFQKNYLDRLEPWRRAHAAWFERVVAPIVSAYGLPVLRRGPGAQPGRILDVGCGIGLFLSVVPQSWKRVGVEPSAAAAQAARDRFGLDVRNCLLEELPPEKPGFDLITFWDVVEHLPDPVSTLRAAARHLAPGGVILVKVPDIHPRAVTAGRLLARVGKGSVIFHIGAHLYQFDERTLRSTLALADLAPRSIDSHPAPHPIRAFFMKGRLSGRVARLGLHVLGLSRSLVAVTVPR